MTTLAELLIEVPATRKIMLEHQMNLTAELKRENSRWDDKE